MLVPKILFNHVNTRKFKVRFIAVAVGGWNLLDPYSGDLPFIEVQIAVPNILLGLLSLFYSMVWITLASSYLKFLQINFLSK
jgi:hypothetical protein